MCADLDIIHAELRAKDMERCEGAIEGIKKLIPRGLKKEQKEEMEAAEKVLAWLQEGKDIRFGDWSAREIEWLNEMQFISSKPVVYLVNLSEKDYIRKKNKWLPKIFEWVQAHGNDPIIPFSGALEQKLFDMPPDENEAYCKEIGASSALPKIIVTGFRAVHLIYFFTAGSDEVKCWQIRKGTKAPQAAGAIHTDFERGFICAEVMHYDELRELGTENAVKAAGKYRQEGKMYEVIDGDIIYFK
jgi:obg-like ATPase 1